MDYIKDYYDERYSVDRDSNLGAATNKEEQFSRLRQILNLAPLNDVNSVLDVGCGHGFITSMIAKNTKARVTGTDFSKSAVSQAGEFYKLPNLSFVDGDAKKLPFDDNSFDLVVSSEIIEHIPGPQDVIEEFYRVVKPGGLVLITTPNPWNPQMPIRALLKKLNILKKKQIFDVPISPFKLNDMVEEAGFKIKKRKSAFFLPLKVKDTSKIVKILYPFHRWAEEKHFLRYFGLYQVLLLEAFK